MRRRRIEMRRLASRFLVLLFAMQAPILLAQVLEKPKPSFALSIEEDKDAARANTGLHRVLVKYTQVTNGQELVFHEEAKGMYKMIVLRDGVPAAETDAMRELRRIHFADGIPTGIFPGVGIQAQLKIGESRTIGLDVSDYYDMTSPGAYRITVTRNTDPWDLPDNLKVSSNTITVLVPRGAGGPSARPAIKPKPRFTLSISPSAPDLSPDQPPAMIRVEMENITKSAIRECTCPDLAGMFSFSVRRDGEPVAESEEMQILQKRRAAAGCQGVWSSNEIQPGEIYAEDVPLGNFYDIYKTGSYAVYATRETFPYNFVKSVLVESNTLTFVVPEPEASAPK
jgi:hypothetical protein